MYDDWPALRRLVSDVHSALAAQPWSYQIMIVDDGSSTEMPRAETETERAQNCESIILLRLRRNLGHQRAIAVGLVELESDQDSDLVVVMDGDGEDLPSDIPRLVNACLEADTGKVVFARRTRRSETVFFKLGYELYCLLHRTAVGSVPRVGNFCVVPARFLSALVIDPNLWNHFAATIYASRLPRYERH